VIGSVDLLKAFQSRAARMAVGASTVRGQRVSGIVEAARAHLRDLPLEEFSVTQRTAFDGELDARTQQLKAALPAGARRWGLARKVLNIFLRDCVYSVHLRDAHGLGGIEDFLELPLDRVTADALCLACRHKSLPEWKGVRYLDRRTSRVYQDAAQDVASAYGVARVHLDAIWWSMGRDSATPTGATIRD
jgi:hypothetical protein